MAEAVKETKAQSIEGLKQEKNARECLHAIRAFAQRAWIHSPGMVGHLFLFLGRVHPRAMLSEPAMARSTLETLPNLSGNPRKPVKVGGGSTFCKVRWN